MEAYARMSSGGVWVRLSSHSPSPSARSRIWLSLLGGPAARSRRVDEAAGVLGYAATCCASGQRGLAAQTLGTEEAWDLMLTRLRPVGWIDRRCACASVRVQRRVIAYATKRSLPTWPDQIGWAHPAVLHQRRRSCPARCLAPHSASPTQVSVGKP